MAGQHQLKGVGTRALTISPCLLPTILSIYLPICLPDYLSIYLTIYLFIHPSLHPCIPSSSHLVSFSEGVVLCA
ncbi:hypothetical protein F5Y12DRAFT_124770 [Xylaria sp. FL1777]|nr:hypothetical protein F5Y12DRAFT_124770 [Xylaria sp. FL1777]